ncbi:MAG: Crp/Fnr family transcriptional regulator, partial [Lachnospiraceae bacterium]|nr:Crp/Fnr family transcriptional regulator [Lachnospiraceae bacterium]
EYEKMLLEENAAIREFRKGDIITSIDGSCLGAFLIMSGSVRAYLLSEEGREITLFRMHRNDICVLSTSCVIRQITFETQLSADVGCRLLIINVPTFERLIENNIYVRCFTYETVIRRFSEVMWSMQQILFMRFDARLAGFLISEYERTGRAELKMTHEEIAQQVSSAREVVARMLKNFAADGLVLLSRGSIVLNDVEGLRRLCAK